MGRADWAERILGLTMSADRAAAIVGDLMETDDGSNRARFWTFVARTAASRWLRQMLEAPFAMAGAIVPGMCVEFGLLLCAVFGTLFTELVGISIAKTYFHRIDAADWLFPAIVFVWIDVVVPVLFGRWISRRYPGKQAAAAVTFAVWHALVNLLAGWACWAASQHGGEAHVDITIGAPLILWNGELQRMWMCVAGYLAAYPALLLAGATSIRPRDLQPRS